MVQDKHVDERGEFQELYRDSEAMVGFDVKQISICTINPGKTRGGHYHKVGIEAFAVIEGEMILKKRDHDEEKVDEILMTPEINTVCFNFPYEWHEVSSTNGCKFIIFQNWEYDPENTDTYAE